MGGDLNDTDGTLLNSQGNGGYSRLRPRLLKLHERDSLFTVR